MAITTNLNTPTPAAAGATLDPCKATPMQWAQKIAKEEGLLKRRRRKIYCYRAGASQRLDDDALADLVVSHVGAHAKSSLVNDIVRSFQRVVPVVSDFTPRLVPAAWELPAMIQNLKRQSARLGVLPVDQKVAVEHFEMPEWEFCEVPGPVPRQLCEGCVFFHENDCSVGQHMDWQSLPPQTVPRCSSFKGIKIELRLE